MSIAGYNHQVTTINFADQAGDETFAVFQAPFGGATIKSAAAIATEATTASTANYFSLTLIDGGAAGTATTTIGTAGGTVGWAADTDQAFTVNTSLDELDAGDWLMVKYDETGTVAPGEITVVVEWVHGKG